jgi:hypothetical protein
MISLSLTTWLHFWPEIHGPVLDLARAAQLPIDGPPSPCEQCERILPYVELWRSMTEPGLL